MTRIPRFDEAAIDAISDHIRATRTYIQSLPHQGTLVDIDTLLAVAEAEARRIAIDLTVQRFAGPAEIALHSPVDQSTATRPDLLPTQQHLGSLMQAATPSKPSLAPLSPDG